MEVEQESKNIIESKDVALPVIKDVTSEANNDSTVSEDMDCSDSGRIDVNEPNPEGSSIQGALPSEAEMIEALLGHCCWVCGATAPTHEENLSHMMTHLHEAACDPAPGGTAAWTPGARRASGVCGQGPATWTPAPINPMRAGTLARASTPRPPVDVVENRKEARTDALPPVQQGLLPLSEARRMSAGGAAARAQLETPTPAPPLPVLVEPAAAATPEKPDENKSLVCAICLQTFTDPVMLVMHVDDEVRALAAKNKLADRIRSKKKKSGDKKSSSASPTNGFACDQCSRTFPIKMALRVHVARAHSEKSKPHDKKKSAKHRSQPPDHMPFQCAHCGQSYPSKDSLLAHVQTHQVEVKKRLEEARAHEARCATPAQQQQPAATLKDTPEQIVAGSMALRMTPVRTSGRTPSRTPGAKASFPCASCGRSYTAERHLRRHVTHVHSPSMPHICVKCGTDCFSSEKLQAHTEAHAQGGGGGQARASPAQEEGVTEDSAKDGDAAEVKEEDVMNKQDAVAEDVVTEDPASATTDAAMPEDTGASETPSSLTGAAKTRAAAQTSSQKIVFRVVSKSSNKMEAASVAAKIIPQLTVDMAAKDAGQGEPSGAADQAKTKVVYMLLSKRGTKRGAEAGAEGDDTVKPPANVTTKPLTKMYVKVVNKAKSKLVTGSGKGAVKTLIPRTPPKVGFKVVKTVVPFMKPLAKPKVLPGIVPLGGYLQTPKSAPADAVYRAEPGKASRLTSVLLKDASDSCAVSSTQPAVPEQPRQDTPLPARPSRSLLISSRAAGRTPSRIATRLNPAAAAVGSAARGPAGADPDSVPSDPQVTTAANAKQEPGLPAPAGPAAPGAPAAPAARPVASTSVLGSFRMSSPVPSTANCICDKCGLHFTGDVAYKLHLIRTHGITVVKKFECQCCGAAYRDKEMLRAHLRTH
ncbi:Zinc finger protein 333 [Frankliniella fusca]|uniref:Zinc finger protein 333 n=1 Tax=Frankliniella fusca TaxID=407009 RepID=A0AAE1H0B1_9NEOP|nr:Zinc finger protein 333 [Frankliniella fusca]